MKMDEEDGKKADLASFPIAIRGRSIEGVFDRGGACLCVRVCVRINASEKGERERETVDVRRAMAERSGSTAFEVA